MSASHEKSHQPVVGWRLWSRVNIPQQVRGVHAGSVWHGHQKRWRTPKPRLVPLLALVILSFISMVYTSVRLDRLWS